MKALSNEEISKNNRHKRFKPFIVYDMNKGLEEFDTIKKALAHTDTLIEEYCDDGWCEDVEQIIIAKVTHTCIMKNKRPAPKNTHWEFMCDYGMEEY